jgi:pyridoxamine 5'-phosphate oxidase
MSFSPEILAKLTYWLDEAMSNKYIKEPAAFSLATSAPSNRVVLLKGFDANGLVFFTHYNSRKGQEIEANNKVACCFFWEELGKQIRVVGYAEKVSAAESDAYFATRAKTSQAGAMLSKQSATLGDYDGFLRSVQSYDGALKRPETWGGYLIKPIEIEFFTYTDFRLHYREHYKLDGETWTKELLYP